jgi:hypothetical protein
MKPFRIAWGAALIGLLAAVASMGQTKRGDMVVDVPFAFIVDGQTLPAGHYVVAAADDYHVRIFTQETGLYVLTHAVSRIESDSSKLVFHRYGDTYFLSAVWVRGNTSGRELFPSHTERELAGHKAEMELAVVRPGK